MKEGFYSITFAGTTGNWGTGILVLDTGMVVGADAAGGTYDGTFAFNTRSELIDIDVVVGIPAGIQTVQGAPVSPVDTSFPVKASFPRETPKHPILVTTPLGPVSIVIKFLRAFPN